MTKPRSFTPFIAAVLLLLPVVRLHAQPGTIAGTGHRPPLGDVGRLPEDWDPGKFDRRTGKWNLEQARNIKWTAPLGYWSFGPPVVSGGKVYVGTNNLSGYLSRYSTDIDLGCLLCFRESDGKFLWQHSSEKLPTGRVNDWPIKGIQSSPWVEGERGWFVTNRGEVVCFDPQGFADGEDDGEPFADSSVVWAGNRIAELDAGKIDERFREVLANRFQMKEFRKPVDDLFSEPKEVKDNGYRASIVASGKEWRIAREKDAAAPSFRLTLDFWGIRVTREGAKPDPREADVIWSLNMMEKFGSQQHNLSPCCVTVWKETLFVCTGNGVDDAHLEVPAPEAPSFVALDKSTGKVLWTSNLPGKNIHHGNWSSPVVGVLGSVPQVIFNGGDGWTYSFHAEEWTPGEEGKAGQPKLLWKFDTNPKNAILDVGGRGTRNEPIGAAVLHKDRVFITTGQDAEHGEGAGCLWCIDPTKRGDVSAELAVLRSDPKTIVPYNRGELDPAKGEVAIPNPNSAVVWKFIGQDQNADGELEYEEAMHRAHASVVISGDLVIACDFSGLVHCLDRQSGKVHWVSNTEATIFNPPLVADGKIYVVDDGGDVAIFRASADPKLAGKALLAAKKKVPLQIDPLREIQMPSSCYTQPTASKGVLFIATHNYLFAIEAKE